MAWVRILVDGYSLLHGWPELAARSPRHSATAREALIHALTQHQDAIGTPITVVFDGSGAPPGTPKAGGHGIEVIYSERGKTADDLIERAVYRLLEYGEVLVVTDDNAERDTVISLGGMATDCDDFIRSIQVKASEFQKALHAHNRREHAGYKQTH